MTRTAAVSVFAAALLGTLPLLAVRATAAGFCTAEWSPVCAVKNGVELTYSNSGCAKADEAEIVRDGRCEDKPATAPTPSETPKPTPIFCTEDYAPVCAMKDGAAKTYSNACHAHADGATVSADGECPKP